MADKLRIICPGPGPIPTKVMVGEHELKGVQAIKLTCAVGDLWRCELTFIPGGVDVEVEALLSAKADG